MWRAREKELELESKTKSLARVKILMTLEVRSVKMTQETIAPAQGLNKKGPLIVLLTQNRRMVTRITTTNMIFCDVYRMTAELFVIMAV